MLCCRPGVAVQRPAGDSRPGEESTVAHPQDEQDQPKVAATIEAMVRACGDRDLHRVGRRPGKEIDGLLAGRILVIGDDADLAAIALRLMRKDLLGTVEVAYAARRSVGGDRVVGAAGRRPRRRACRHRRRTSRCRWCGTTWGVCWSGRANSGRWPAPSTSTNTGWSAAGPTDSWSSPTRPRASP